MSDSVQVISLVNLTIAFLPVLVVLAVLVSWSLNAKYALYAMGRMLLQLLIAGYVLTYIFRSNSAMVIIAILAVMVFSSSWIALGTVKKRRPALFLSALIAIGVGGSVSLFCVTQGVLSLTPWFLPQYVVPLAGMIFAGSMNSVSLAAERLYAEMDRGEAYDAAKHIALKAALIPVVNSLLAVGLVSIPGMMTGQILSGVSPLVAARYQIMVMCMIFGAAGISAICFLIFAKYVKDSKAS